MKVLVCGGRDYRDRARVSRELAKLEPCLIINGGAPGADTLSWDWAFANGVECRRYLADWKQHGRAAGPIRNQLMLDRERPDVVLAFPGGRGTADMVRRAESAGVRVIRAAESAGDSRSPDDGV